MRSSPFATILALLLITSAGLGLSRIKETRPGMGFYPEIAPFNAAPEAIRPGQSATLSWQTRGAMSVSVLEMTGEEGAARSSRMLTGLPPAGSLKVEPRETTIYRMRCETVFSGHACLPTEVKVEVKGAPRRNIQSVDIERSGGF
jgi:hypothetical protein